MGQNPYCSKGLESARERQRLALLSKAERDKALREKERQLQAEIDAMTYGGPSALTAQERVKLKAEIAEKLGRVTVKGSVAKRIYAGAY